MRKTKIDSSLIQFITFHEKNTKGTAAFSN